MIGTARLCHIKLSNKFAGLVRNSLTEMPFTVTLGLSGLALQFYGSYMLVQSGNPARIKLPLLKYRFQDSNTN